MTYNYDVSNRNYPPSSGPNFRWWIPADGIRRDVIQADIQRYLGPEAVVRPGEGRDADRGLSGYWIAAYRTLTPAMVQDLKADSANFERSGDTGRYESSMVHRSRQHWGPSTEQTSTPTDRQTSRADSDSTNYSRTTTSSYNSNPQYSSTPSYGYETQYSRGEREQEPSRGHQQTPRDPYLAYAGAQPSTYGGGNAAIPSGDNYTHHPSTHQSQATGIPYGYTQETGYGRAAPDYTSQAPRSSAHQTPYPGGPAGHGSGYATGGHSAHTSSISHPSATTQRAPPGYYLASDGKYYPESSRPSAT